MIKIAICDDDVYFTGELEKSLQQNAISMNIELETDVFFDGSTLEDTIAENDIYDLIFLDIQMQVDGLHVARKIRQRNQNILFIFVSSHEEYLKDLFEVEPFRFLSKPIDQKKFSEYFRAAYQRITERHLYLQFKFNKEIKKIRICDICYFESKNRIVHAYLINGKEEQFYDKLNDLEEKLSKSMFCFLRIHQSFLVNYNCIKKICFSHVVILFPYDKEICLQISENRKKKIRSQLAHLLMEEVKIE